MVGKSSRVLVLMTIKLFQILELWDNNYTTKFLINIYMSY